MGRLESIVTLNKMTHYPFILLDKFGYGILT